MKPHEPVLLKTVLEKLDYTPDATIVDATVGHGGHAIELAKKLDDNGHLIALDVDRAALAVTRKKIEQQEQKLKCKVSLVEENFGKLGAALEKLGVEKVDLIFADLGINSDQLARAEVGLSFNNDGPLDMRLDKQLGQTAADLVNKLQQDELAEIIFQYGQERHSRAIAREIINARAKKTIATTKELAETVNRAVGRRTKGAHSRIHPATRTFQALRIVVNDEIGNLERLLQAAPKLLKQNGMITIISFHSLEDRPVKNNFRENKKKGIYEILTKKVIKPDQKERQENRRSRSAKMRIARYLGRMDD